TGDRQTMIETRGEGGYVIAPPSGPKVHASGRPYGFLRGRPNAIPAITEDERQAFHTIARSVNQYVNPRTITDGPPRAHNARTDGERPGDDYNVRGDYEGILEAHGWTRAD